MLNGFPGWMDVRLARARAPSELFRLEQAGQHA